ncbi:MAG: rhomboid family intramembrane serine protease [Bacteroidota bacterium]
MWLFFFVEASFGVNWSFLGIVPRTSQGLVGILTAPLIHGSIPHIVSNTIPLLMLGTILYLFYKRVARAVFLQCYFFTGILVWLFARNSIHIGASGVIYGLAFFLIFFGFFRKDFKSLILSILILVLYDGLFIGVLPSSSGVSWESHLFGAGVGFFAARRYGKLKRVN